MTIALIIVGAILTQSRASPPAQDRTQSTAVPSSPKAKANAKVTEVVDGDTIVVNFGRRSEHVRFIGVDTPETVDPKRPKGCFGDEASAFTKSLLPRRTEVRLELDTEPRDRFGRLLAYVYRSHDAVFINAELARAGYATTLTMPPNITYADEFRSLVATARQENRGLWRACPPMDLR